MTDDQRKLLNVVRTSLNTLDKRMSEDSVIKWGDKEFMTGQSFYDKFEKEFRSIVTTIHPTDIPFDDELDPLTYHVVMKAAKKAAGI